jgi:hypothetical protein
MTLANIGTMVNMLRAANIPVVIGNLPPCQLINSYRFNWSLGEDSAGASNVSSPILGVPIIDYSAIATDDNASSVCAANLFDPNTAGYDLMVPLAEAAISQALQAASKAQ